MNTLSVRQKVVFRSGSALLAGTHGVGAIARVGLDRRIATARVSGKSLLQNSRGVLTDLGGRSDEYCTTIRGGCVDKHVGKDVEDGSDTRRTGVDRQRRNARDVSE